MVGCSGSVSGPAAASSSYLVQAEDASGRTTSVLLDLGSGAFGQLLRYAAPEELDAVLLSHLHADHVVDLAGLSVYLKYAPGGPFEPVPLWGPEGTSQRLVELSGNGEGLTTCHVRTWQPGAPVRIGPLTVEPFVVEHPVPAYAIRVTGPAEDGTGERVLTYTGDTDVCDGVVEAARDADLLLSEAAFQEGRDTVRGIHLTGRRAGEVATAAGAKRLALTHIPPWTSTSTVRAEALTAYFGTIDVAEPGVVWEL